MTGRASEDSRVQTHWIDPSTIGIRQEPSWPLARMVARCTCGHEFEVGAPKPLFLGAALVAAADKHGAEVDDEVRRELGVPVPERLSAEALMAGLIREGFGPPFMAHVRDFMPEDRPYTPNSPELRALRAADVQAERDNMAALRRAMET